MMKLTKILAAAALIAPVTAASAQSANDARCIVLSNVFAREGKDANAKQLAEASLYFYLGRLTTVPTAAQLKTALDSAAATLTDANAGTLMAECVKPVQARVQVLAGLSQQANPKPQPPATKPPSKPEGR